MTSAYVDKESLLTQAGKFVQTWPQERDFVGVVVCLNFHNFLSCIPKPTSAGVAFVNEVVKRERLRQEATAR